MSAFQRFPTRDLGLLILRGAGFLLAVTFGVQKIGWYWTAFHAGKSLSAVGLVPLIARMGFPIPVVLALWITFNESIGALLIGCGFLTRLLAASAAVGMAGALYTSVRLDEDWLRAGALSDRLCCPRFDWFRKIFCRPSDRKQNYCSRAAALRAGMSGEKGEEKSLAMYFHGEITFLADGRI